MNKYKIEIKWAIIFMVMMLTWMSLEKIVGLHSKHIAKLAIYTNLVAIPAILIYVFALLDKRKKAYKGKMTYSQGFISGLIISIIITIFSPLTQYITSQIISPNYFANAIEFAVQEGQTNRIDAESFFNLKSYIRQVLIATPIMGIITTAIVAIFVRKG